MSHSLFAQYFKFVSAGHAALVCALILGSSFSGCFQRHNPVNPLVFTVEVPAFSDSRPVVQPVKKTDPVVSVKEDPKDSGRVEPKKAEVQVSNKKIVRPVGGTRPKKLFSDAELKKIEKLLVEGAVPSTQTIIPGEEDMCFLRIKDSFYKAWENRPSLEEVGGATSTVMVRFLGDGTIVYRQFTKRSGKAVLDDSVWRAVSLVSRVNGLTEAFLKSHNYEIRVAFKLEDEGLTGGL